MKLKELIRQGHPECDSSNRLIGKLLTLKNGKKLLVGDINVLGGVCDDCTSYFEEEEILEIRNVWNEKDKYDKNDLLETLVDMVNQFACVIKDKDGGEDTIGTGGLFSLELAFKILKLNDPCSRNDLWKILKEND
ncbi:hypothetical protein HYV49_05235 [Candidatus Pacearchaeota archaeon]|nr:hypothetical protein [Candidatus Pacearchaeota archaeon]